MKTNRVLCMIPVFASLLLVGCASDTEDEAVSSSSDEIIAGEPIDGASLPDLRAVIVNNTDYCTRRSISFRVVNVGRATAAVSVVRLTFDGFARDYLVTSLAPGASSSTYSHPLYFPSGDLAIDVRADARSQVRESSEWNNVAKGYCVG